MNKLVVVILSIAFLAYSIPSALSAAGDQCATSTSCLRNSSNTQCCLQNATNNEKTCQTVTNDVLNNTSVLLKMLPGTETAVDRLQMTVDRLDPSVPLPLNNVVCTVYNRAQLLVAQGGI